MKKLVGIACSCLALTATVHADTSTPPAAPIVPVASASTVVTGTASPDVVALNAKIQAQIVQLQAQQQQQLQQLNTQLQAQIKDSQTQLQTKMDTMNTQLQAQMKQIQTSLQQEITQTTGTPAQTEQSTSTSSPSDQSIGTPTDQSTYTPTQGASPTLPAANPKPCHALEAACKSAGYFIGGEKTGKGLKKNCVKPLLSGQTVMGVIVNPSDVQACLAIHAAHHN